MPHSGFRTRWRHPIGADRAPPNPDLASQQRLVAALLDSRRYPHAAKAVHLIETHISWVLLAGRYAYKIKKAIDLDFLDFTRLDARRFFCTEEIRLNRRFAPKIYLDVVPIGGSPDHPRFGVQPAFEYAVRMRRFASSGLMDHLLERDRILPRHIDSLAAVIARFHRSIPAAPPRSAFGSAASIHATMQQNFEQLDTLLTSEPASAAERAAAGVLQAASETDYRACRKHFAQRRAHGFVRECHGDLHLGNIALIGGQPVPFDGIEFDPALRWIDVINDIAFTVTDLLHRKRPQLAYRLLNAYLEANGDYAGMVVLPFYCSERAVVRAKINAIQAAQPGLSGPDRDALRSGCRDYLALAATCLARRRPALVITHGLPGSGKTTFAQRALEKFQAIRIRSDVERKRLETGAGRYGPEATQRTYSHLLETARLLLKAGFPVIVDAAFLKLAQRDMFRQLARDMNAPFAIASMHAGRDTLRARIAQRLAQANDASEADLVVLDALQAAQEVLAPHELRHSVRFASAGEDVADAGNWDVLAKMIAAGADDDRSR